MSVGLRWQVRHGAEPTTVGIESAISTSAEAGVGAGIGVPFAMGAVAGVVGSVAFAGGIGEGSAIFTSEGMKSCRKIIRIAKAARLLRCAARQFVVLCGQSRCWSECLDIRTYNGSR